MTLPEFERYFRAGLRLGLSNYAKAAHMGISIRQYRNRLKEHPHLMELYVKSHQRLEGEHINELKRLGYEEGNVQALKYLENQVALRRCSIATFKEKAIHPEKALIVAKQRLADKLLDIDMTAKELDTIVHSLLDIEKHAEFKDELLQIIKEYKAAKESKGPSYGSIDNHPSVAKDYKSAEGARESYHESTDHQPYIESDGPDGYHQ